MQHILQAIKESKRARLQPPQRRIVKEDDFLREAMPSKNVPRDILIVGIPSPLPLPPLDSWMAHLEHSM